MGRKTFCVVILVAFLALAAIDFTEHNYRLSAISALLAVVNFLILMEH